MNVTPATLLASEHVAARESCHELARAEQDLADASWWCACMLAVVVVVQLVGVDWEAARIRARRAWRRWRRSQ